MRYSVDCHLAGLVKTSLFHGFTRDEIRNLIYLLGGDIIRCTPGTELPNGDMIYLLLSGQVALVREDLWGGDGVMDCINPDELVEPHSTEYRAVTRSQCTLLQLRLPRDRTMRDLNRLENNIMHMKQEREDRLLEKADILSRRSVRGRILSYLSCESRRRESYSFQIALTRQALADYLCVDRTKLSAELVTLQRDGLLKCQGNRFTLYPETWRNQIIV